MRLAKMFRFGVSLATELQRCRKCVFFFRVQISRASGFWVYGFRGLHRV